MAYRSRVIPTVPYSRKDFAKGKGKEAITAATIPFRKFKRDIRALLREGDFAGAKRTAKALGLDESLLPDSYKNMQIDNIIKKKIKKKQSHVDPPAITAEKKAITAASDARAEWKSELDNAIEKRAGSANIKAIKRRKAPLRNPREFGRLSLLSGGERGIHSSLLGGRYRYSQSYRKGWTNK